MIFNLFPVIDLPATGANIRRVRTGQRSEEHRTRLDLAAQTAEQLVIEPVV